MKVGYMHYDGGSGTNMPFKKHDKVKYDNPDFMYEGGPNATTHIFGATTMPLDFNFDYTQLDLDIVYFWLQGGVGPELNALKKFRKQSDAVFVLFFDDIYWVDPSIRRQYFNMWKSITDQMDVVTSGYLNDDQRVKEFGKPWKYLPYPHDTKYYKKYFKKREERENTYFSMIHGRKTEFKRAALVYKALYSMYPNKKYIVHPYRFYTKERVLKESKLDFLEFTPVVDDWLDLLSRQRVQIDEYPCLSQSQVVTQAACVGTPTISHQYNSPNAICFPKLTFRMNGWSEWVGGAVILETPSIYDAIQQYAYEAVEEYNFENFRKRLTAIYEEFKK